MVVEFVEVFMIAGAVVVFVSFGASSELKLGDGRSIFMCCNGFRVKEKGLYSTRDVRAFFRFSFVGLTDRKAC